MVRIATSIAAVTLLAGTALAQGYYDEQFECASQSFPLHEYLFT
jgi:hypothetical protein